MVKKKSRFQRPAEFASIVVILDVKKMTDITDTTTTLCPPLADRLSRRGLCLLQLSSLAYDCEGLKFIYIRLRQIAEGVSGIEDERAELSDHGIIES